jgi:hypothetical protein
MTGDIMQQMAAGIDNTKVVLVFITQRYAQKVGGTNQADNCKLEFQYATRMKTKGLMVPIIMEDRMKRPSEWTGPVGFALGGELALRMSFDFGDSEKFKAGLAELKHEIDVRLKSLDAAVPEKAAASVTVPAPAPAPVSKANTPTELAIPNYTDIFHALLHGAGENVKIRKSDGPCAGRYLYLRKNKQLDLTDDKEKANNWAVKPKRQNGKLGFSIILLHHEGEASYPSLVAEEDSGNVKLNKGSHQQDEGDFWVVVPKKGVYQMTEKFRTFQIVSAKLNGPMVAEWNKRGNYLIRCQKAGIGSKTLQRCKVQDSLWQFESSTLLKSYPGQQIFSKIYDQSILNEKPVKITNLSNSANSLRHNESGGKVHLSSKGNSGNPNWFLAPWQEKSKSCIMITSDIGAKFQLALDTDGETVMLKEETMNDAEYQDNKWGLVPVEERGNEGVYVIRKCLGLSAGVKLAVEKSSGKILCSAKKDPAYCYKWILSL